MKRIYIAMTLAGIFIPAIASAELNYDAIDVAYGKTSHSGVADLKEVDVSVTKSVSKNIFIEGAYATGSQPSGTIFGDFSVDAYGVGLGYHAPIKDNVDLILAGLLIQGTEKLSTVSASFNGYQLGLGVRAELTPLLEGTISGIYSSSSANSNTTTALGGSAEIEAKITSAFRLFANVGHDSVKPQSGSSYTTNRIGLGARYYY